MENLFVCLDHLDVVSPQPFVSSQVWRISPLVSYISTYRRSEECRTRYLLYSFEYFSKAAGRDRHITGWHRKKTEDHAGCRLCVRWNGHGESQGAAARRIRGDYQRRLPSIHSSQFFHKILALTY